MKCIAALILLTASFTAQSDEIARRDCSFSFVFAAASCVVSCPYGMKIKRVSICYAQGTTHERPILGTSMSSNDRNLWCNVGSHDTPIRVIAEARCE